MGGKESKPGKRSNVKGSVLESDQIRAMYKKVIKKDNHKYLK
jgi:hypothetical protein